MGVGGAMSRTSVNSSCRVKSPLSGLVTTAVILVCIYELVGTLYWIPKATLAGIIICAVWPLIYPPSAFYRFWKTSLADFISSMLSFWLTLFYSSEYGIFVPVAFNIAYIILRQTFTGISSSSSSTPSPSELSRTVLDSQMADISSTTTTMPQDVQVFHFNESIYFPNSHRLTAHILETIQTHHAPDHGGPHAPERERARDRPSWSVSAAQRLRRLRRAAGIADPEALPPIGLVVLDFGRVSHVDATAVYHLRTMVWEVRRYGGGGVEVRFVGMAPRVRDRFVRAGWGVVDAADAGVGAGARDAGGSCSPPFGGKEEQEEQEEDDGDGALRTRLFGSVAEAVVAPRSRGSCSEQEDVGKSDAVDVAKPGITYTEDV